MDNLETYRKVMKHPYKKAITDLEYSLLKPLDIICKICGVEREQVLSTTRKMEVVQARHAIYCWTYMSLVPDSCRMIDVAHFFGIHHATLLHALNKLESLEMSQHKMSFCQVLLQAFNQYEREINSHLTSVVRDTLAHASL